MTSILVFIFTVQQALDVFTTHKALSSGRATEANPVVQIFLDRFGSPEGLIIAKFLVLALVFSVASPTWWFNTAMVIAVGLYGWVLYNNFNVLRELEDSE